MSLPAVRLCVGVAVAVWVFGCAPLRPKGILRQGGGDPFVVSDGRVALSVLPYSPEMEDEVLGIDLHRSDELAVEVAVENLMADAGRVFVFRRHYALAVFDDGTQRYPIDPMKVYEKNRVNLAAAQFWLGLSGYWIAEQTDERRRSGLAKAASNELRLTQDAPRATGFLYFDTEEVSGRRLVELIVDYEELGVDELWRTTADLGGFEFRVPERVRVVDGPRDIPDRRRLSNPFLTDPQ